MSSESSEEKSSRRDRAGLQKSLKGGVQELLMQKQG